MHQEALRLHGPAPAAAPPIADTPPSADAAADASGREGGAARWEHDHGDGPQPVALLDENGVRRIARVAGPLLPSGRFEASSSSSSSDSADDEEDDHEDIADDAVCSPDHGPDERPEDEDAASLTWSETSLVLEGPSLAHSKEVLYSLYRRELQDKAAEEEQAWSSPSGRRTAPIGWFAVQQLARQRLSGARALEWSEYEHRATHEQRPRRRRSRSRGSGLAASAMDSSCRLGTLNPAVALSPP